MPESIWPGVHAIPFIKILLSQIAEKHGFMPWELKGKSRSPSIVEARKEFCFKAYKLNYKQREIADIINRERSTISHLISTYPKNIQKT